MNSRRKGVTWELKIKKMLEEKFPGLYTTRNISKFKDDVGIDLLGESMPFYVQVKATKKSEDLTVLLDYYKKRLKEADLPEKKPIIIVKVFSVGKGHKRQPKDILVCIEKNDADTIAEIDNKEVIDFNSYPYRGWRQKIKETKIHKVKNSYYLITLKQFINLKFKTQKNGGTIS